MKPFLKSLSILLICPIFAAGVEQIAEVTHPGLGEMSGIVASTFEDVYCTQRLGRQREDLRDQSRRKRGITTPRNYLFP